MLNILDKIGKAGAQFTSLRETWADTTTPVGRPMVTVIGGIAEFKLKLIRARPGDGIPWTHSTRLADFNPAVAAVIGICPGPARD